jgi:ribosomal protein S8E
MADRIPTYIDTVTERISEIAVGDGIDVTGGTVKADAVEVTNLTIDGDAYAPYDDAQVKTDIATNATAIATNATAIGTKLDADKIWTGTEAQYNNLTPNADTLYFIV